MRDFRAHHSFETDDIDETINDFRQCFSDDPSLARDDHFPIHTLFPIGTPPLHCRNPRPRFTPIVDVRFRTLQDFGSEFERKRGESGLDVDVESVEEQHEEGEDENCEERKGTELEVAR